MPILAPDRNKPKIAGVIMSRLMPSYAQRMQQETAGNLQRMNDAERNEELKEDTVQAGAMALRAMFSAMQDGDFEAAYRAYESVHRICDAAMEGEDY